MNPNEENMNTIEETSAALVHINTEEEIVACPASMYMNQENMYERVREELYRSFGMTSGDSLMNENERIDINSHDSFNNVIHLDEDGEADEEYNEVVESDEEHILGDEFEEYDVDREPEDLFTEKNLMSTNHELLPALLRLMAGHRSISESLKRDVIAHDRSDIRSSKNIRLAEV
ncbi:hypothetical protein HAX54_036081 [Datura stramonium]|uniref:Uncharacterized protein n=1 Tax=Datura stramonium TaxID=4076 RepID=A0ABS8VJG3_DATST|nr:hypothetical protein [Datura stramonium]